MRALIIGRGSIGQRHREVLCDLGHEVRSVSSRLGEYRNLSEAFTAFDPEYVVIANNTLDHLGSLQELVSLNFSGSLLIEKPILSTEPTSSPGSDSSLPMKKIAVGYQLRFHPLIEQLREKLQSQTITSVQMYVGQYLPAWRPERDYRAGYSAKKILGGGILRDLSHELDLAVWLFGKFKSITAISGHFSKLETDVEDTATILGLTERCPAITIELNCVDRTFRRFINVNTQDHTFRVDLISGTFTEDRAADIQVAVDRNSNYSKMHQSVLAGQGVACTLSEALGVLKVISSVERASEERIWINLA